LERGGEGGVRKGGVESLGWDYVTKHNKPTTTRQAHVGTQHVPIVSLVCFRVTRLVPSLCNDPTSPYFFLNKSSCRLPLSPRRQLRSRAPRIALIHPRAPSAPLPRDPVIRPRWVLLRESAPAYPTPYEPESSRSADTFRRYDRGSLAPPNFLACSL